MMIIGMTNDRIIGTISRYTNTEASTNPMLKLRKDSVIRAYSPLSSIFIPSGTSIPRRDR